MSTNDKAGSDSDSDSDDFFTFKPAIVPPPKLAAPTQPVEFRSSSPDYESYDSDDSDSKKRRKRKRSKSSKPFVQPSWLDTGHIVKKGRGTSASTDREGSKAMTPVIEVELDEEEDAAEKEKRKRERIIAAITPPPTLSAADRAQLRAAIDETLPMELAADDDDEELISHAPILSSDADFEPDERLTINFRMVADPDKRAAGVSEKALQRYEKAWSSFVNRRDPLGRMVADIAERMSKDASDIILEYRGTKLLHRTTPISLGIQANDEVEMLGYESFIYEKVLRQREADRAKRLAELEGGGDEEKEAVDDDADDDAGEAADEPEPEPAGKAGTILRLRGKWGEATIRVADNISVKLLATHYCKKTDHPGSEEEIRLEFDGERLEMDTLVGDLGVEDRDMIDVVCP